MPPHIHPEKAQYDEDGNVVILSHERQSPRVPKRTQGNDHMPITAPKAVSHVQHSVHNLSYGTRSWIESALSEGKSQIVSARSDILRGAISLRKIPSQVRHFLVRFAAIARSPIRIGTGMRAKQRSRLTYFLIDTVRFGGTFAFIFSALFVGINYESFWKIAKADLALGNDAVIQEELLHIVESVGARETFSLDSEESKSLVSYLPSRIGPPINLIIIPSLATIAPIVEPSTEPLIAQDWKRFEEEIQKELLKGVVMYPGSARPGNVGNVFLTGHSSYYPNVESEYKQVFASLHRLNIGDEYFIYYKGDLFRYRVVEKKEVKPTDVSVLDQPVDEHMATLMTCTPIGTTLRRLIVTAKRVDPETGKTFEVADAPSSAQSTKQHKYDLTELPI